MSLKSIRSTYPAGGVHGFEVRFRLRASSSRNLCAPGSPVLKDRSLNSPPYSCSQTIFVVVCYIFGIFKVKNLLVLACCNQTSIQRNQITKRAEFLAMLPRTTSHRLNPLSNLFPFRYVWSYLCDSALHPRGCCGCLGSLCVSLQSLTKIVPPSTSGCLSLWTLQSPINEGVS